MATQRYHAIQSDPDDSMVPNFPSARGVLACPPRKPLANTTAYKPEPQKGKHAQNYGPHEVPRSLLADAATARGAKALLNQKPKIFLRAFIDVRLAILPCLFMVLGIIAASLNGQETSPYGRKIEEAAKLVRPYFLSHSLLSLHGSTSTWLDGKLSGSITGCKSP